MKADPHGSPSEQAFAHMGWVPAREAKAKGMKPCGQCKHFIMVTTTNGWGGVGQLLRCTHRMAFGDKHGQATRETASCAQWEWRMQ